MDREDLSAQLKAMLVNDQLEASPLVLINPASQHYHDEADQFLRQAVMKGYRNAKNAKKMIDNRLAGIF